MIVFLLLIIFLTCSVSIYSFSYRINSIDRNLTYFPISLLESSIPLTDIESEAPYFDKDDANSKIENYIIDNVSKYTSSYEINTYFYNLDDGGYCLINNCQGVVIEFSCKVLGLISYSKTLNFRITENK